MAHEIGHVAACHAARENTRANLMQMMTIPLIFIGGPIGYAAYEGAGLAVPLTFLNSREASKPRLIIWAWNTVQGGVRSSGLYFLLRKSAGAREESRAISKALRPILRPQTAYRLRNRKSPKYCREVGICRHYFGVRRRQIAAGFN